MNLNDDRYTQLYRLACHCTKQTLNIRRVHHCFYEFSKTEYCKCKIQQIYTLKSKEWNANSENLQFGKINKFG